MVYEPHEDSFLLKTFVQKHARGNVLDMGTGSGIQAVAAHHKKNVKHVWAVDIDPKALAYCKKHHDEKISWIKGDLFSPFKQKIWRGFFDTILFNAPYLPDDETEKTQVDLVGGKHGYELIDRFLQDAPTYLAEDGIILLTFSSLSNHDHIMHTIDRELLEKEQLGKQHHFFEHIYVYRIKKSPILQDLNNKGVDNVTYLARGKRGVVYTGQYRKKKIAIKIKRATSKALNTISKEAKWLKELNKHDIGPAYLFHTTRYLAYEFVEGKYLKDLVGKRKLGAILKKILDKCYTMDTLNINKEEMTRPLKHTIVKGHHVTLIDFERTHKVKEGHNVTQFCQFLRAHADELGLDGKKIITLAKDYSEKRTKQALDAIKKEL